MTAHRSHYLLAAGSALLIAALYLPSVARSFGDGASWSVSDLHISYAAGFIRRGLLGEAAARLQDATGLSTGVFFPALFMLLTAALIALQTALAWPLRTRPALFLLVMFSPALVLFPAYDYGGYLRKDAFIVLGLFVHAIVARGVMAGTRTQGAYRVFAFAVLAPYLAVSTLIHENQAIFLPVHALLIYMACGTPPPVRHILTVQGPAMAPAALCFVAAVFHHGDAAMAAAVCNAWTGRAETACDAINFLAWGYDQVWIYVVQLVSDTRALSIFAVSLLLALVPPFLVRRALPREGQAPLGLLLAATAPTAVLFLLGWDWGRWIHLICAGIMTPLLAGAVCAPAPVAARRYRAAQDTLPMLAAWMGALLYISTWRVNVCCLPTTLRGGLAPTLAADIPAALRNPADTERATATK